MKCRGDLEEREKEILLRKQSDKRARSPQSLNSPEEEIKE